MRFQWHEASTLTDDFVSAWRALGKASGSPLIYLEPDFLLPAIEHLKQASDTRFAVVWNDDLSEMHALCALDPIPTSRSFPVQRLALTASRHSFQAGLLIREDTADEALRVMLTSVLGTRCDAIQFSELRAHTWATRRLREAVSRDGHKWITDGAYERASLTRNSVRDWRERLSSSRKKKLRRARKRLEAIGEVDTRIVVGDDITDETIDRFLHLESLGWKAQTSLLNEPNGEDFFRDVTDRCRTSESLWFCELSVGGRVIASTANFLVGKQAFAFKIGMDPEFSKCLPGWLVECALLDAVERGEFDFEYFDSGSEAGGYLESLWGDRATMLTGHVVAGARPKALFAIRGVLKTLLERFRGLRSPAPPTADDQ